MPDLPRKLAALTTGWLTEALRASNAIATAEVTAFEATQIGTFSSELWRIHLQYDQLEPGAPQSLVAKRPREDPRIRVGAGFATEIDFYQDIAPQLEMRLPRMYYGQYDEATGDALLLLEYVEGIVPVRFLDGVTAAHSARAIDALATMHARWWGEVDDLATLAHLADESFRTSVGEAYDRGWRASREFFEVTHDPAFVAVGDALVGRAAANIAPLGAPATLLHGDAHFENLPMVEGNAKHDIFFHDWAAVRRGHAAFDVAVFSVQSYPTDSRRRNERQLVQTHAQAVRATGIDWNDPWEDYRRGVLYWMIHMLEDAELRPGAKPWIVIDRYVAAAVDLDVGDLIV
ncbi:MAG: hypothetical protein V3U43_03685 [Pseudomonadales bacterium]